ncbi:hypothetical protein [Sphingopyxis kveilinensis]|uniref:hypothetical protein n=1 Tax=Sphingopyxis kveilinensis TaxID=3114367 RepID=UPI0030D4CB8E
MSESILYHAQPRHLRLTTLATLGVLVTTAAHHIYGADLFSTPWRLHIVYISIPAAILILGTIPIARADARRLSSRIASWVYFLVSGGFAVGMIGFYEGGYNHLLPNIQYVLGAETTLREGLYQPPDDPIFQLSGIAQFFIALFAGWGLVGLATGRGARAAAASLSGRRGA